jgi:acylglycerol lipase
MRELPRFLLGQSMGGAVSLKVHLKEPYNWDGVILVAPMCKVSSFLLCIVTNARQLHYFDFESIDSVQPMITR